MRSLVGISLWGAVAAIPHIIQRNGLEHKLEARDSELPIVKLGYSMYQATSYDKTNDIYSFMNIRFAAPPIGHLRFAKPAPPIDTGSEIQTGLEGGACPQAIPQALLAGLMGRANAAYMSGYLNNIDLGKMMSGSNPETEDCLFLDVIVPGRALRGEVKLPVANWIYGGAYILGDKGGIYNASSVVRAAQSSIIHVAGNYRLGAFGFLAGSTVEKDGSATANAGFHDQRAVLEWIQKYIGLFGGDASKVTVWGESAGGGSIVHHLTQNGGTRDPLFKRAIIQSPGYSLITFDRKGKNERTYRSFLRYAGCEGQDLGCLREMDTRTLKNAQEKVIGDAPEGTFAFGPSADGGFVRQPPQLELASGNYFKDIESVIITHVTDEASMFVIREQTYDDHNFTDYVDWEYGNKSVVTKALMDKFKLSLYPDARTRLVDYVKLSTFTCTTRMVAKAYSDRFWVAQVQGIHGADLITDFYDSTSSLTKIAALLKLTSTEPIYQRYLVDYIRSGNPSSWWPKGVYGPEISKVLDVSKKFALITDKNNRAEDCDIIIGALSTATAIDGYAPPNGTVKNMLFDVTQLGDKASRNFKS